jgi:hypothetical protein
MINAKKEHSQRYQENSLQPGERATNIMPFSCFTLRRAAEENGQVNRWGK